MLWRARRRQVREREKESKQEPAEKLVLGEWKKRLRG